MPKNTGVNIARVVYDSYPHSDLLPIDPDQDCRSLRALMSRMRDDNIGDSLFRFLVVEIIEGGEGTLSGAIRVVSRARDDVEAVLEALIRTKSRKGHAFDPVRREDPGSSKRAGASTDRPGV